MNTHYIIQLSTLLLLSSCGQQTGSENNTTTDTAKIVPTYITDAVQYDTDDPAIWLNPEDPAKSLIIGTDKDTNGGLFVFNLQGKMLNSVSGLKRPNNVDVAYGLMLNGKPVDIAVTTERKKDRLRIYSMPALQPVDQGGIPVFEGAEDKAPMGIALYTAPDHTIYAIVGRKTGPAEGYLWQYRLEDNGEGQVKASLVRQFGRYSGKKEIEAIAVDNENGYVYYADETYGVHKYYADPSKGNEELAVLATQGFVSDHEGISLYKTGAHTGYILVSNQQKNTFMVYPREGLPQQEHEHPLLAEIPVSTIESDGSEACSKPLGSDFPKGIFVAMSNGRVFHLYDWRLFQARIDTALARAGRVQH